LLPQALGMIKEFYPHLKQIRALCVDSVVPDDPSVQGQVLVSIGDSYFQKALFGCGSGRVEHVQTVRMNGVCEQCQPLLGDIVKSSGEERGGDFRAGRKIDSKLNRKVQSGSLGAAAFSYEGYLHQTSNSETAFAWPYKDM